MSQSVDKGSSKGINTGLDDLASKDDDEQIGKMWNNNAKRDRAESPGVDESGREKMKNSSDSHLGPLCFIMIATRFRK